jgi:hypothetical protein
MRTDGAHVQSRGVANIGPRERRRRLRQGIVTLILGALLGVVMARAGVDPWWRLALVLPFWTGALGVSQAREETCVILAARGARNLDEGVEPVEDEGERRALRHRARLVYIQTSAAAVVFTALSVVIME